MGQQSREWKSSLNLMQDRLHEETYRFRKQVQVSIICRCSQNCLVFYGNYLAATGESTEPETNSFWYNWIKMTIMDQRSLLWQFPWETALTSCTAQQTTEGWESVRGSEVQRHMISVPLVPS